MTETKQQEKFGNTPLSKIGRIELSLQHLSTREEAAFLQYQLLVKPEILQCHIDFETKTGSIVFDSEKTSASQILKELPKPVKGKLEKEQTVQYTELLENQFHL